MGLVQCLDCRSIVEEGHRRITTVDNLCPVTERITALDQSAIWMRSLSGP